MPKQPLRSMSKPTHKVSQQGAAKADVRKGASSTKKPVVPTEALNNSKEALVASLNDLRVYDRKQVILQVLMTMGAKDRKECLQGVFKTMERSAARSTILEMIEFHTKSGDNIPSYTRDAFVLGLMTDPRSIGKQLENVIAYSLTDEDIVEEWFEEVRKGNESSEDSAEESSNESSEDSAEESTNESSEELSEESTNASPDEKTKLYYLCTTANAEIGGNKIKYKHWLKSLNQNHVGSHAVYVPEDDSTGPGPDIIVRRKQDIMLISCKYTKNKKLTGAVMRRALESVTVDNFFGGRCGTDENDDGNTFMEWRTATKNAFEKFRVYTVLVSLPDAPKSGYKLPPLAKVINQKTLESILPDSVYEYASHVLMR